MKGQLPKVRIFDTDFLIDKDKQEFRQADNADNRIPFHHTIENDNHIALIYDKKAKNVYTGSWWEVTYKDGVHIVNLPSLGVLADGVGIDSGRKELHHYGLWLEAKDIIGEHKKGYTALPVAPIDDTLFFVDLRMEELREKGWHTNRIRFSELDDAHDLSMMQLIYAPKTRNQFYGSREEFQSRPEVKHAIFPSLLTLDRLAISHSIQRWVDLMANEKKQVRQGDDEKQEQQSRQEKKSKGRSHRI